MKKFLTLFAASTSLLATTSCSAQSVKLSGTLQVTIGDTKYPINIDSSLSLNEGELTINDLKYVYEYSDGTLHSHFDYKGTIFQYNLERNSITVEDKEYFLNKITIMELQELLAKVYIEKHIKDSKLNK